MSSAITLSITGLIVGFIFSMPIAGPISILITSNALNGRTIYCRFAALGASVADFIYVFFAVYGLTRFYTFLKPAIPFVLFAGMIFLLYLGYKISKTKIDLDHIDNTDNLSRVQKQGNGFFSGFFLNFLNPTLFFGWLTSSFIVISLVTALGFNTGGLNQRVDKSFNSINKKGEDSALRKKAIMYLHLDSMRIVKNNSTGIANNSNSFSLLSGLLYAFFLSVGGLAWFFFLTFILAKHRYNFNIKVLNALIHSLGYALYLFGIFLGYHAISLLKE
jgi:threonine/homoserine/homoserine lactone efflux protein